MTFGPLMLPLLILMPLGPLLSWKRADFYPAMQRLFAVFITAVLVVILILAFTQDAPYLAAIGIGLAAWVILGAFAEIGTRANFRKSGFIGGLRRIQGLPRTMWGTALGHLGMGVMLLGIVGVSAFEKELVKEIKPKDMVTIAGYELIYNGVRPVTGPNYSEPVLNFSVSKPGERSFELNPTKRFYTARKTPTTESAIKTIWLSQLYLSLGDIKSDGTVVLRVWWKPLIVCIWLGAMFMTFGGVISLSDRRLRVGVAKISKTRSKIKNVANAV